MDAPGMSSSSGATIAPTAATTRKVASAVAADASGCATPWTKPSVRDRRRSSDTSTGSSQSATELRGRSPTTAATRILEETERRPRCSALRAPPIVDGFPGGRAQRVRNGASSLVPGYQVVDLSAAHRTGRSLCPSALSAPLALWTKTGVAPLADLATASRESSNERGPGHDCWFVRQSGSDARAPALHGKRKRSPPPTRVSAFRLKGECPSSQSVLLAWTHREGEMNLTQ